MPLGYSFTLDLEIFSAMSTNNMNLCHWSFVQIPPLSTESTRHAK